MILDEIRMPSLKDKFKEQAKKEKKPKKERAKRVKKGRKVKIIKKKK